MAELVATDTGSKLVATCRDNETKTVIDLTGATVHLKYKIGTGAVQTKDMTIRTPQSAGVVEYQFLAGELTTGSFTGEVEITSATATVITQLEPIRLEIRAKLA